METRQFVDSKAWVGEYSMTASRQAHPTLQRAQQRLQQMRPLVERVLAQTRARVVGGDTHVPDKVLSVFEPHTETIRKGKIAKPNEFGKLVTIQESEHQIITAYEVHATRPADVTLWTPALDRHQTIFGRAPDVAAGDRGFASAANEQAATTRGVPRDLATSRTAVPRAARLSTATVVPSVATVARRLRRVHQRPQASAWLAALSVSWPRRHAPVGRLRGHRRQPDQHRRLPTTARGGLTRMEKRGDRTCTYHECIDQSAHLMRMSSPESS